MKFEVYRIQPNKIVRRIAETVYLEDAQAVLANWHDGHIMNAAGRIVVRKVDGKLVVP